MHQSLLTRLFLHAANLVVIGFILLPLAAAVIGAFQSEKSLQASTRTVLPPEWTLDQFPRDPVGRGADRRDLRADDLPAGQRQEDLPRARQQHRDRAIGHVPDPELLGAVGLYGGAAAAALGRLAD